MSQPTPHVAEKELCELRDHMKGCKSCPVGVPCVIAFNIRLKISEKEIQRLTREVEILEPCVREYADESKWWTASHSITDESRRHLDVLFAAGVHVMKHGYEPATDAISQFEKVRGEK